MHAPKKTVSLQYIGTFFSKFARNSSRAHCARRMHLPHSPSLTLLYHHHSPEPLTRTPLTPLNHSFVTFPFFSSSAKWPAWATSCLVLGHPMLLASFLASRGCRDMFWTGDMFRNRIVCLIFKNTTSMLKRYPRNRQ